MPLNLTLPRETPASKRPQALAIEKQIGARASQSLETRIAAAIGPGQWTEELQSPDRIRLRNGNTCVTLERSRIDLIDPFYAKEHPTPWQVGQRTAC